VVWGLQSGEETKDQDACVAAFAKMHPEIQVSLLSMGAGSMDPQKLMTAIVGKVPPDVVQQDRFTVGDWASRGAFMPLDSYIASDARSHNPMAIRQSDYVPATWQEAVYHNRVYAIPDSTDDRVLYYNKSAFRAAGLDPNKPPRTWDELIHDAVKLTHRRADGSYSSVGIVPLYGQGWLYEWSWQQEGEYMSADGRRCTIANPYTVKALSTLCDWYNQLGGRRALDAFAGGFAGDDQDPFMIGKMAMRIDGDGFIASIARWHPEMDFGVVPIPVPSERYYHQGRFKNVPTWVTWSGGFSYAIPIGAKHTKEAWEFIQWMNSPQAALVGAQAQAAYVRAKGRLFIPGLYANNNCTRQVFDVYKGDLPTNFRAAKQMCIDLLPVTRFRPATFVGQTLWDEQNRAVDNAMYGHMTPQKALDVAQSRVQTELDAVFFRDRHRELPSSVFVGLFALGFVGLIAYFVWMVRQVMLRPLFLRREARAGLWFMAPWGFGFIVFTVGPIIASMVLSFCDYDVLHAARWCGLSNYTTLFTTDRPQLMQSLGNAAYIAIIGIPLGMVTSLGMAMLLNTNVRGQQWYRTFYYMPTVVPVVASVVLWSYILNSDPSRGLVNALWSATLSQWFHVNPPGWLAVAEWAKPSLIVMGLWGAGGGMILWLAGLQSIPATLYEAARIDGAGSWSQFKNVTLPMLSPYVFFNLIMGLIGALQTFDSAYIMGGAGGTQSNGPDDSLLMPVVYLFNNAFRYFKMGYASALAWVLFVLILGLTLAQLKLAPKWVHYETETK
jgi:multiple sugar transport system permease protein